MRRLTRQQIDQISSELRRFKAEKNLTNNQIYEGTGVDQSQICRIMKGSFKTSSKNVQELCKYAKIIVSTNMSDRQLIDIAIQEAWDGSDKGARLLADAIQLMGELLRK